MFTVNPQLNKARQILSRTQEKPKPGTILSGLKGLPVRIHCQLARGSDTEIFAYATLVPLLEDLTTDRQRWYLRDYASTDLAGTKVILTQKSRDQLINEFASHPVLEDCDVLPVKSLRIIRLAASKLSMEAEIAEMLNGTALELCAEYARIALSGDAEATEAIRADFYKAFNEA